MDLKVDLKSVIAFQRKKMISIICQSIYDKQQRYLQILQFAGEIKERNILIPEEDMIDSNLRHLRDMLMFNNSDTSGQIDLILEHSSQIIQSNLQNAEQTLQSQLKQPILNNIPQKAHSHDNSPPDNNSMQMGALYNYLINQNHNQSSKRDAQKDSQKDSIINKGYETEGFFQKSTLKDQKFKTKSSKPSKHLQQIFNHEVGQAHSSQNSYFNSNSFIKKPTPSPKSKETEPTKQRKVVPQVKPFQKKQNKNVIIFSAGDYDFTCKPDEVRLKGTNGEVLNLIIRPDTNTGRNKSLISRGYFEIGEVEEAKFKEYIKEVTEIEERENILFTPQFKCKNFFHMRTQNDNLPILSVLNKEDMELIIKLEKILHIQRRVSQLLRLSPRLVCSVMLKYKNKYNLGDKEETDKKALEEEEENILNDEEQVAKGLKKISPSVKVEEPFDLENE